MRSWWSAGCVAPRWPASQGVLHTPAAVLAFLSRFFGPYSASQTAPAGPAAAGQNQDLGTKMVGDWTSLGPFRTSTIPKARAGLPEGLGRDVQPPCHRRRLTAAAVTACRCHPRVAAAAAV